MVDVCGWKTDRRLVPEDQIEWLLSLLLKAEERRWRASISPVNSSEHDDLEQDGQSENPGCTSVDAGSHLLRHGRSIKRIHETFHLVEPSHYCVKVTANSTNPDRPSSQMRVVSTDSGSSNQGGSSHSRTSTVESQEAGGDITAKHPLFELYKNAVLCAQYPVLSVSQTASPNTPYSPVSSPPSLPLQRKFSFSRLPSSSSAPGGAKLNSGKRRTSASSDTGCVSPEVCLPISSDVLQDLVMNVFQSGKRQHKYICETEIPKQVPRAKEPQRFLVEELLSRLVVLERNHHPFYSVQAFMDKNAYSEWVMVEKEKIDGLIRSFWHYARPPVRELPLESPEFHKQYVELMKRLVRFESKHKEPHPVYGGAIPSAPLSSEACRLLKEFELRYGVGTLFCKISYLEYLVKYFENELWYIQHTTDSLHDVMDLVFTLPEIYVAQEFKMLLSILSSLLAKTKYSLTRIRRIFPVENSPKGGVTALVTLFELTLESARQLQTEFPCVFTTLLEARQFACHLATEPTCDLLASYVKDEMVGRYERIKVIATDELRQNFSPPQLLLKLILEIHHEVNYYNMSYKQAFVRYFDMMELAAVKFYSLLMQDVEQLCQNPPRTQRRDNVDPSMLCLAFRLSKLDKEWAKYIPYSHQSWRQPFHDFALQWLDAIGHYFQRLVPQLISRDAWEAVEVNISASRDRRQNMKPPGRPIPQGPLGTKSPSLLSLTPSQHSAFNTVGPSNGTPVKSRGKEPLKSRKDRLGSSPPIRVKSPRRRRPGVLNDSSSEEDTPSGRNVSPARSAPKSYKVNVIAQINNMPRARGDSSSQGQPSEEGLPSGLGVNRKEIQQQGSSELIKPYQEESISHMATAQNGDEAIEETVQSGSGTQPLEINGASPKDGQTSGSVNHTEDAENNTTSKVERPEVSTEKNQVENSGSSMKEESGVAKPLENGASPKDGQTSRSLNNTEDAEINTTSKVERLEGSTEENQVENSDSSLNEGSGVAKPLENGKHHEGAHLSETQRDRQDNTRSKLDQLEGIIEKNETECSGSTITGECGDMQPLVNGESSVSTITQEPKEKTFVVHSPDTEASLQNAQSGRSENHVKSVVNQPQENTEKVNGERSASGLTEVTPKDASHENGDSISERSWHSKASESRNQSTPFENDTTDGSDSDGSVHTSDSFNFIEDEGKTKTHDKASSRDGAVADPNSLSQRQQREGPEKETSNIRTVSEKGFQPIVPIEDEGRGLKRQDGEACQTCPARQTCFATEKNEDTRRDAEGNKQNTGRKVPEQRPSAPVAIPAPRNRFLDKLRDTQSGSGGSKRSECGSFFSAVGSVDSGCTIETFRTARSGSGSSQSQKANGKDDSDHSDASHSSKDSDMPHVLPISSSFVDVLCAVNRLASFACHLCKILCPEESPQRGEPHAAAACSTSEDDHLRNESLGIKRRLYHKLIQVMLSFIRLYSDNVLGMETCGLPDDLLTEVLGDRVQRHLRAQRNARHLQGCRYNPSATQCCNTVDRSGTFIPACEGMSRIATNPGEFEPLTQQMGVRMSNVAVLRNILAWLLNHVTSAISNPDACSTEYELSLSYCENGPSLDSISISSTGEGRSDAPQPRTADVLHDPGVLNDFTEHFCRLEISQVKLVTYRINKLFKQVLRSLLNLRLPGFTIRKRLTPAMELLSRELQRFHSILYPDNFTKVMIDLWAAVARNFEEESNRLVRRKSSATQQSQLLLQAVAFLMQFFHGGGDGLAYDTLAAPIDPTVQYLQLYTNPTDRLISMYHSLYKQVLIMQQQYRNDEFTSSVSVSSHQASANAPADFVIQAMLRDLHVTRKCFSGAALVKWIENYVRDNGYDNLGVCIGSTETETGEDVGQYLLERGMLVCVSPPPRFDRQQSADRTRLEQSHEEKSPKERGTVFVRENVKPEIRVNGIEASSSRSSRSSPACSSRATSSRSTPADSTSSDEADDECDDDDDDFLGSASDVWSRANSRLSERDATFYNHPKAFYKFICEEDSSRTEVKISLGITDRLNLPVKLKHILCVLYSRKNSDKTARNFLKRLPGGLLEDAVGREGEGVQCYPLRGICQTL